MSEIISKKTSRYYSRPHSKEEKKQQNKKRKKNKLLKTREERRNRKRIKLDNATDDGAEKRPCVVVNSLNSQEKTEVQLISSSKTQPEDHISAEKILKGHEHAEKEKETLVEASGRKAVKEPEIKQVIGVAHETKKIPTVSLGLATSRGKKMVMFAKKTGVKSTGDPCVFKKPSVLNSIPQYRQSDKIITTKAVAEPTREIDPQLISKMSDAPIGNGSFGTCYLASYRNITVAVKEMTMRNNSSAEKARCRMEVLHESRVLHELGDLLSLPLLLGICSVKEPYCLILQFHGIETESLTLQKAVKRKLMNKSQTIQVFRDICTVLQFIHRKGYLHNDIKSNNVLLETRGEGYQAIMIDFGKSKPVRQGEKRKRTFQSASYLAPEVCKGNRETTASDVFSFGKMLEVAVSHRSFKGSFTNLLEQLISNSPLERPKTEEIIELLNSLQM